jgi:MraZ protein
VLSGEHQHALDPKGRISFPAKLREELGEKFVITKGLDGCLFVYPLTEWDRLAQRIRALPMSKARDMQRFFFGGAMEAEPDKQGRVLITASLRAYAGFEKDEGGGCEVMIVGTMDRAEIWDKRRWEQRLAGLSSEAIEAVIDDMVF